MRLSPFHSASASSIPRAMIRSETRRARYAWARHTSSQYRRLADALLGSRAPQDKQNRIRATPSGSLAGPSPAGPALSELVHIRFRPRRPDASRTAVEGRWSLSVPET
ncbi:hypothetical protein GCM10010345_92030 [Streptomyces canarius]|uniref:Uncharacterized protein n=1 Tax=Streptomyces canarius TaxID=285453 RepID=A0ABQ3DGW0_9ACTN|nr:hypothetical protein GCM10010345_92030 [Streptomyces canarius]